MMIVGVERQSRATKRGDLYLLGAISGIYIYIYIYVPDKEYFTTY